MTAAERALLLAVLLQMATTLVVGVWMGRQRFVAVRDRTVRGNPMLSNEGWPARARQASNNFSNQFEIPVLFYALAILALWLKAAGPVFVGLAWVFALSRIAHAFIHCGSNSLRLRMPAYFVGVVAVIAMLGLLAAAVIGT